MQFKNLIYFVIGAAVGSVATYHILYSKLEEESNRKLEASIRDMEDYFQGRYSNKPKPEENSYDEDFEEEKQKENDEPVAYNEIASYKKEAPMEKKDDRPPLMTEEEHREQVIRESNKPPYTITPTAYATENTWYDKKDLIYYASNRILVMEEAEEDDDDPVVRDVDLLIGSKNLTRFGEYEDGVVYIRNDNIGVDYCVRRKKGRYSGQETVLDED